MPMLIPFIYQSPDSQRKSIDWFQHEKNIDTKNANNNEINICVCLDLSKSVQQLQRKVR